MSIVQFTLNNKRLPFVVDTRKDVILYGEDNLYPQRIDEVMNHSNLVKSAVERTADFVTGDGFQNGELIVNRHQHTLNDLLRLAAEDLSQYSGFAIHCNFDVMGNITEMTHVPFEDVRLSIPDDDGEVHTVKVSSNWVDNPDRKKILRKAGIPEYVVYPLFNPDALGDDVEAFGSFDEFPGQVLYWTPRPFYYPLCTFDSVLESAQTNGEIQKFELGSIQNGFLGNSIFKYPGDFKDPDEKNDFIKELSKFKGSQNANSIMVVEVPVGSQELDLMEQVPANDNDSLFELTNKNIERRITQAFGIPPALLGIMPDGGFFNQEQLQDSYLYYNIMTNSKRNVLEREFNKLAEFFQSGPTELGEIQTLSFNGNTNDNPSDNSGVLASQQEPEQREGADSDS